MQKNSAGFTLIELILAIFFITVGTVGAFSLLQRTLVLASISSDQLKAAYLAQEGVEIVRNIRDSNWLAQRTSPSIAWDANIDFDDKQADYQSRFLSTYNDANFLNIDSNGFYGHSLGTSTKFKRKITISKAGNLINILVAVSWEERGRTHQFAAQTELTNWR